MASDTREARYKKNQTKETPVTVKKQVPSKPKKIKKQTHKKIKKQKVGKQIKKEHKIKKRRIIRWKNVFLALFLIGIFTFFGYFIFHLPITNIYVEGNTYFSDQKVIELAGLSNYPSIGTVFSSSIQKKLEKEEIIKEVKITKHFRKITIQITENKPLFYYESIKKTVLTDGTETTNSYIVPSLINYVPDTIYSDFLKEMKEVKEEVLSRISEIQYAPDEVDTGRFLLTMTDGNYVYLTLTKWDSINSYFSIMKEFPNQKGILYLNAGNSFEVFE